MNAVEIKEAISALAEQPFDGATSGSERSAGGVPAPRWRPLRVYGWIVAVLAALTGWVRVFLGVHFPFDILGSMIVAALVTAALAPFQPRISKIIAVIVNRFNAAIGSWMVRRKS